MAMIPTSRIFALIRTLRPVLLTLIGGFALTMLASRWISSQARNDAQTLLDLATRMTVQQVESRLATQVELLRGLQSAFQANPTLSRQTFHEILEQQNIRQRVPGFIAIGLARAAAQNNDSIPVIDYLYPANTAIARRQGFDPFAQAAQRAALSLARSEARGIASPPMRLGESQNAPLGFMLHYPIFQPAGEKPYYLGSLTAIYQIEQILSETESGQQAQIGRLRLYDVGGSSGSKAGANEQLLHTTRFQLRDEDSLCASHLINIPGRQWRLEACSSPALMIPQYRDNLWLCWFVGSALSLLAGGLLWYQKKARDNAAQLVEEINADLRQHEKRQTQLEFLLRETHDPVVIRDEKGRIDYMNPAAVHHFGQNQKSREQISEPLLVSAELGELQESTIIPCSRCNDQGQLIHYEAILHPMRDVNGQYIGSALIAHDLTRRMRQAEELRKANEHLSDLLELSSDWLWEQDAEGRFTLVSGGPFKAHDINPACMTKRSPWERGHMEQSELEAAAHHQAIEQHRSYRDFVYTLESGNEQRTISLSGKPVFNDAGDYIGYRGIGQDISALHGARMLAQAEKLRMLATLESISDGVITTDLTGRIDYMNPVAIALIGREPQEAIGQPVDQVFQVVDLSTRMPLPSLSRQVLASGAAPQHYRNSMLLNRFGLSFLIQEAAACIRDQHSDAIGSVLVFRDLSDWLGQTRRPPEPDQEKSDKNQIVTKSIKQAFKQLG